MLGLLHLALVQSRSQNWVAFTLCDLEMVQGRAVMRLGRTHSDSHRHHARDMEFQSPTLVEVSRRKNSCSPLQSGSVKRDFGCARY